MEKFLCYIWIQRCQNYKNNPEIQQGKKQNPLSTSVMKSKKRRDDIIKEDLKFDGFVWTGFILIRVDFGGRF